MLLRHKTATNKRIHRYIHANTSQQLDKWINLCQYRERQAYIKTGKFVNSKWKPLSHNQLATFIKFMGKELGECKRIQNGGKKAVDSIF